MGQQQLLLIVLGVIIVGVAVVVGIDLFNANSEQAAKDTTVAEATNLGALAQQFYKKPTAMGGGGGNFTSFAIPTGLDSTNTASYSLSGAGTGGVTISGNPWDFDEWNVTTVVTSTSISSKVGT